MAMINCRECENEVSKQAKKCPNCGIKNPGNKTSIGAIFFLIVGICFLSSALLDNYKSPPKTAQEIVDQYPVNIATYEQVNREVGCNSTYSENKKRDVFNSKYKNQWFAWSGIVVFAKSKKAALDIDDFGIQDISVKFLDKKAGYNLIKGSRIRISFLMKDAGGCFLPFKGEMAVILK